VFLYPCVYRQTIWFDWSELVKSMDSSELELEQGKPISNDEYKRVVLSIACAVANPSKSAGFCDIQLNALTQYSTDHLGCREVD
jgi:hypothetical protein